MIKRTAVLPEDPDSVSVPMFLLTTNCNSGSIESDALFWPLWSLHECGASPYM